MSKIVTQDKRTVTAKNLESISKATSLNITSLTANDVRNLCDITPVPVNHEWRISLLPKLLHQ